MMAVRSKDAQEEKMAVRSKDAQEEMMAVPVDVIATYDLQM
jgi:hypothetical protein